MMRLNIFSLFEFFLKIFNLILNSEYWIEDLIGFVKSDFFLLDFVPNIFSDDIVKTLAWEIIECRFEFFLKIKFFDVV